MIRAVHVFIETRSKASLIGLSLTFIAGVGVADYITGYFISVGLFYTAPIALLAGYVSSSAGIAASVVSAGIWHVVNLDSSPPEVGRVLLTWNTVVRLGFFLVISALVSLLKRGYDRQRELARTDGLTGLLNGRAFREQAEIELVRARRSGSELAILFLDIDNFKAVNDLGGHRMGDELLRTLGAALSEATRSADLVGRMGGDEFAIALSGTGSAGLKDAASRVLDVAQAAFAAFDPPVSLTIGALVTDGSQGVEDLIRQADRLMYEGKSIGGGSIVWEASEP